MANKRIVIAGGGLAGSTLAHLLQDHADVTLVDSKDYFEIRWAALRGYVEPKLAEKIVIPHAQYLPKARVVVGTLAGASDRDVTLADGTVVLFDLLVITTGSQPDPSRTFKERIAGIERENKLIRAARSVLIVGGGPVGVEMAGEIKTDFPDKTITIVHAGERLIEFLAPPASQKALKWLQAKGIGVMFGDRLDVEHGVTSLGPGSYTTRKGVKMDADYVFFATGSRPDSSWLKESFARALGPDDRLKVDGYFVVEGHPNVFALGDITDIKEAKQGYFAVAHAKMLAANLKKTGFAPPAEATKAKGLKSYKAGPSIGIVSLGRAQGLAQLPFGTFTGFLPTKLKSKDLFVPKVRADLGLPK